MPTWMDGDVWAAGGGRRRHIRRSLPLGWQAARRPWTESGEPKGREGEAMVYVVQSEKVAVALAATFFHLVWPTSVRGNDLPCAGSMDGRRHGGGGGRTRNVAWVGRHRIRREAGWRKKRGSGRWRRKKARSMLPLSLPLPRWRAPSFLSLSLSLSPRWWWWLVEAEGELLLPPQTLSASAGTLSGAAATLVRWTVGPMSRPLPPCGPDDGRRRRVGLSPSPSLAEKENEWGSRTEMQGLLRLLWCLVGDCARDEDWCQGPLVCCWMYVVHI